MSTQLQRSTHFERSPLAIDHTNERQLSQELEQVCPVCNLACTSDSPSIGCDVCDYWLHYKCENLQPEDIKSLEQSDEDYICTTCSVQKDITTELNTQKHRQMSESQYNNAITDEDETTLKSTVATTQPSSTGSSQSVPITSPKPWQVRPNQQQSKIPPDNYLHLAEIDHLNSLLVQ